MMKICIYIPITRVDYLDQTFSSVVRQTCQDFQVLVMDNTIGAHQIVKEKYDKFFGRNDNARLIHPPHHLGDGDPTKSWNYGLDSINTDFFTLLGDDDSLKADYVEKMLALISEHKDAPIYRCKVNMINENDVITKYGQLLPQSISWDEYIYNRKVYKHIQSTSEFCINTASLKKIGGYLSYPFAICSDDASYITLMLSGNMVSTNSTCAYWRRHGSNLSMRVPYKIRVDALDKYYQYVQDLLNSNKHVLDGDLVLNTVKTNVMRERLLVAKNKFYKWKIFRPFIKYLYKKRIINSI